MSRSREVHSETTPSFQMAYLPKPSRALAGATKVTAVVKNQQRPNVQRTRWENRQFYCLTFVKALSGSETLPPVLFDRCGRSPPASPDYSQRCCWPLRGHHLRCSSSLFFFRRGLGPKAWMSCHRFALTTPFDFFGIYPFPLPLWPEARGLGAGGGPAGDLGLSDPLRALLDDDLRVSSREVRRSLFLDLDLFFSRRSSSSSRLDRRRLFDLFFSLFLELGFSWSSEGSFFVLSSSTSGAVAELPAGAVSFSSVS